MDLKITLTDAEAAKFAEVISAATGITEPNKDKKTALEDAIVEWMHSTLDNHDRRTSTTTLEDDISFRREERKAEREAKVAK